MRTACANCGAALDRPPSRLKANPLQYCGFTCLGEHRRRRTAVPCAVCATPVEVKASRAGGGHPVTCGPICLGALRSQAIVAFHGTEEARQATCLFCGASFTRKPSQIAKYAGSFCNRACKAAAAVGPRPEQRSGSWTPCEACGVDVWRTAATLQPHTFCSRLCAGRAGQARPNHPGPGLIGDLNPHYKGGRSDYAPGFTRGLSRKIRLRDENKCQGCGAAWVKGKGNLVAHHMDHAKYNHDPSNLITLCRSCHTSVHVGTLVL